MNTPKLDHALSNDRLREDAPLSIKIILHKRTVKDLRSLKDTCYGVKSYSQAVYRLVEEKTTAINNGLKDLTGDLAERGYRRKKSPVFYCIDRERLEDYFEEKNKADFYSSLTQKQEYAVCDCNRLLEAYGYVAYFLEVANDEERAKWQAECKERLSKDAKYDCPSEAQKLAAKYCVGCHIENGLHVPDFSEDYHRDMENCLCVIRTIKGFENAKEDDFGGFDFPPSPEQRRCIERLYSNPPSKEELARLTGE